MTTPPKSSTAIYRKAAERILKRKNIFSCFALVIAGAKWDSCEMLFFEGLFKPEIEEGECGYWDDDNTEVRVLALLLAAEITERGGL